MNKKCNSCLTFKNIKNYHKDKYKPDGYCSKCKECFKNKKLAVVEIQLVGETKLCECCFTTKDLYFFSYRLDRGYYEKRCRDCAKK